MRNYYTHNGVTKKLRQWAKETGLSEQTIRSRIDKNYLPELVLAPIEKVDLTSYSATNNEAWAELTPEQLETMREFDQLGRIAKC